MAVAGGMRSEVDTAATEGANQLDARVDPSAYQERFVGSWQVDSRRQMLETHDVRWMSFSWLQAFDALVC